MAAYQTDQDRAAPQDWQDNRDHKGDEHQIAHADREALPHEEVYQIGAPWGYSQYRSPNTGQLRALTPGSHWRWER